MSNAAVRSLQLLPHTESVDGIQRAALEFSRGLAAVGAPATVLTLGHGNNLAAWEEVATVLPPAPYLRCAPARPLNMARTVLAARRLRPAVDVVIAHRLDLLNAAAILAARTSSPLVFHAHNSPPPWLRWGDPLRVPGTRRVDRVIVASEFMRREWEPVLGDVPVAVVPYPIDVEHFAPPSIASRRRARSALGVREDEFVAGYVGRLEETKGPHVLMAAGRRLHESGERVRVLVQGAAGLGVSPADAHAYRERCAAAAGECPVTWVPPGPDVRETMHASDVCCVPSIWPEPSGLTVAEALATGSPLVASAVGGIPEQLPPDSPQARLVPPDDPESLVSALAEMRGAPASEAQRLALRAHIETSRGLSALSLQYRITLTKTERQ
ncbi:MAG TPA: glycosyltransferase family 4 protein [Solirubrobacterales bacterium]|nr:glycosyltransferase family 4 protein [Solirubrobacterales bacterium]